MSTQTRRLTDIKGIGDATAETIREQTGCTTATELVSAYLTESDAGVHDAVRRVDSLNDWILQHYHSLSLPMSLGEIKVMLFLVELGCDPRMSCLTNTDAVRVGPKTVDGSTLTSDDIQWVEDTYWSDSSHVAALARSMGGLGAMLDNGSHNAASMYAEMAPCDSYEGVNNTHTRFTHPNGATTLVSGDYLDTLETILTFDYSDVECHPEGNYPVLIEDQDTELVATIAPRIEG